MAGPNQLHERRQLQQQHHQLTSGGGTGGSGGSGTTIPGQDVCQTPSGAVAWTASIPVPPPAGMLDLHGLVGGPTNDVVVAEGTLASSGWLLNVHRYDTAGHVVSLHQDTVPGFLTTTNLALDAQNNVGYAYEGTNNLLSFTKVDPSGGTISAAQVGLTSPYPEQIDLGGAGADSIGNLYVSLVAHPVIDHPWPFSQGSHLFQLSPAGVLTEIPDVTSSFMGMKSPLPVSPDGHIYRAREVAPGSAGCPAAPLSVPLEGAIELAEHDTTGACVWAKLLDVPYAAVKWLDFSFGADGTLALAVQFTGTIDLGNGPLTSTGASAVAIARFDASGNLLWDRSFDGLTAATVRVNAGGTLVLQSGYAGTVDLGAGALPTNANTVLAAFDTTGQLRWNRAVLVDKGVMFVAVSPCALILATNSTSVDLGSGPLSTTMVPTQPAPLGNSIGIAALAL